ncbi:MAG: dUTP diphosphatase, partial [Clostridia bacterium]|nr:dUTP diphosphatase [Clostridia bacterium]
GEITVAIHNHSSQDKVIAKGDRIAQIAIVPYLACEFEEGELSSTERGAGGFGSTGK